MHKPVLDHGYVEWIESWGSDQRIVEAARMSTDKGFLGWDPGPCPVCGSTGYQRVSDVAGSGGVPIRKLLGEGPTDGIVCFACDGKGKVTGDRKLLAFLYSNHHDTPFEMAGMVLEVKAPIFVFREWHRHRTQSYNEMSARYIPLPNENYTPTLGNIQDRIALAGVNKQARGASSRTPSEGEIEKWLKELDIVYGQAQLIYEYGLQMGIPKELARLPVPVARYSKMRASANLRNWLAFLTLRNAPNAQWEIRQYAQLVAAIVEINFPETYALFAKGR